MSGGGNSPSGIESQSPSQSPRSPPATMLPREASSGMLMPSMAIPRNNLPEPQPDRPVARNGREHQRLKSLLRRNPGGSASGGAGGSKSRYHQQQTSAPSPVRSTPRAPAPPLENEDDDDDDDDEWLIEGTSTNGHVNAAVSAGRETSNLTRSVDTLSMAESETVSPVDSAPPSAYGKTAGGKSEKRKGSKSKSLAKKTSRLFGRNGSSHSDDKEQLAPPIGSGKRQNSVSSAASGDSVTSKHWSITRVAGKSSPPPRKSPDTATSQPSSWHPPPPSSFALRRTSSSTTDTSARSESSNAVPIPHLRKRDSSSHLSASVPTVRNLTASTTLQQQAQYTQSRQQERQDGTVGNRVSAWFSNFIPTSGSDMGSPSSHTDSPQPQQSSQAAAAAVSLSPLRKQPSVAASFLSGARNKAAAAARYVLDSEAQPDHCQDTMWVLGSAHPGWTPRLDDWDDASSTRGEISPPSWTSRIKESSGTYASGSPSGGRLGHFFGSSFNLAAQATGAEPATPPDSGRIRKDKAKAETPKWPEEFYDDLRSRVWCTYRSQYSPIAALPAGLLLPNPPAYFGAFVASTGDGNLPQPSQMGTGSQSSRLSNGPWSWVKGDGGLTSDAGWGCMLRTGQSVLANALVHLHLGRGWRLPQQKPTTHPETPLELAELKAYATYVRILSWFLDDPSPLCPFSVHRMALIGKELGKEVGEWFGPSTAAGALKTLVNSFPLCGLAVANAVDSTIYRTDVYAASNISSEDWKNSGEEGRLRRSRPSSALHRPGWGGKAVLILINIRLGLDGVNPIYYDSIKTLFTFPQSVGIAGGRPSSSYYFVASQANMLFYLDPHFTRPAVPLRTPPPSAASGHLNRRASTVSSSEHHVFMDDESFEHSSQSSGPVPQVDVISVDDETTTISPRKGSSKTHRRPAGPPQPLRLVPDTPPRRNSATDPSTPTFKTSRPGSLASPSPARRPSSTRQSTTSSTSSFRSKRAAALPVDPQTAWYASAYSDAQMRTFHCDKIRKLPLSGLDPSMLLGFLCHDEADFEDFCERVAKLPQKIFTVQDEPPVWSEDEGGLESVSEPVSEPEDEFETSDHSEEPDLDLDDVDEFGRLPSRPRRNDATVTVVSAAGAAGVAAGLATFVSRTFTQTPPTASPLDTPLVGPTGAVLDNPQEREDDAETVDVPDASVHDFVTLHGSTTTTGPEERSAAADEESLGPYAALRDGIRHSSKRLLNGKTTSSQQVETEPDSEPASPSPAVKSLESDVHDQTASSDFIDIPVHNPAHSSDAPDLSSSAPDFSMTRGDDSPAWTPRTVHAVVASESMSTITHDLSRSPDDTRSEPPMRLSPIEPAAFLPTVADETSAPEAVAAPVAPQEAPLHASATVNDEEEEPAWTEEPVILEATEADPVSHPVAVAAEAVTKTTGEADVHTPVKAIFDEFTPEHESTPAKDPADDEPEVLATPEKYPLVDRDSPFVATSSHFPRTLPSVYSHSRNTSSHSRNASAHSRNASSHSRNASSGGRVHPPHSRSVSNSSASSIIPPPRTASLSAPTTLDMPPVRAAVDISASGGKPPAIPRRLTRDVDDEDDSEVVDDDDSYTAYTEEDTEELDALASSVMISRAMPRDDHEQQMLPRPHSHFNSHSTF